MRPQIEVNGVRVTFGTRRALDDVDFVVRKGEHTLIRGGNGAGKSTLLRVLRGEQWPDQRADGSRMGKILWCPEGKKKERSPLTGREMTMLVSAGQQEKVVRQEWNITGEELVLGGFTDTVYMQYRPEPERQELAMEVVQRLRGESLLNRKVAALSQGQLRLLLVARALVCKPEVLLLDEATEGLDAESRRILLDALEVAAEDSTLVLTSHRAETVPDWVQRDVSMYRGRMDAGASSAEGILKKSSQACWNGWLQGTPVRGGSARIQLQNATVYIDREEVLHDLTWLVQPGENWAVIGSNGAGKSTLLRLLAGDELVAWGGSVERELPRQGGIIHRLEDWRRGVRLVSDQQQAMYTYDITGKELVVSGIINTVGLYHTPSRAELATADAMLSALDLTDLAEQPIRACSTGQLRRLLLARALMGEPDLLLLDEPFSGLDPFSRESFVMLLEQIARQGVQMILVTHHETDIIPSVNRLLYLDSGRISRSEER